MKHESVDYSQRTAASPDEGEPEMLGVLRRTFPYLWIWNDPVAVKRMRDEMSGALAGQDTSQGEDARLRQESPEPQLTRKFDDEFWSGNNPEEWRKKHFGKL